MEVIYQIQIKGTKENKYCWRIKGYADTLKHAIQHYNFYKSGCCKRILRIQVIKKLKVVRYKKY